MATRLKAYLVGDDHYVARMFQREGWELARDPEEANIIQFLGGHDLTPGLYDQGFHVKTQFDIDRDLRESALYRQYTGEIPMAGICRGGQFLWAVNGGQLFQDVNHHVDKNGHMLYDFETNKPMFMASSIHHQMMMDTDYTLKSSIPLAYAKESTRKEWVDREKGKEFVEYEEPVDDLEVAFFPNSKCLCFQPHPEIVKQDFERSTKYYFDLVWNYLIDKG